MIEQLTKKDVIRELRQMQGDRSLRTFATAIGVSAVYLSDIYNARRDPGKSVLKHLGIRRETITTYTRRTK